MRSISGGVVRHPHPTLLASLAVDVPMLGGGIFYALMLPASIFLMPSP